MGRQKTVHKDLPPKMVARLSGGRRLFYLDNEGTRIPLGDDLNVALRKYAEYKGAIKSRPSWDFKKKLPEEIAANAMRMGAECGVYFLLQDAEIVYVGQSVDIWQRLQQHRARKAIRFNGISWLNCSRLKLEEMEAYYIKELRPKYNVRIPNYERFAKIVNVQSLESIG